MYKDKKKMIDKYRKRHGHTLMKEKKNSKRKCWKRKKLKRKG